MAGDLGAVYYVRMPTGSDIANQALVIKHKLNLVCNPSVVETARQTDQKMLEVKKYGLS